MIPYRLTPAASEELQSIVDFIRHDDPDAALRVLDNIEDAMNFLASAPTAGRLCEDLGERGLRLWLVYSYLIIYRPATRPLEIVHVVHGARDLVALLGEQKPRILRKRKRG